MKVKAVDVARALGISKSTVSFVMNDRPGVSPETRERVLACIREMEEGNWYKSKRICIVSFLGETYQGSIIKDTQPFYQRMMEGIEREIRKNGYVMELRVINEEGFEETEKLVSECNQQEMAGVMLLATFMKPRQLDAFRQLKIPCVIYDNDFQTIRFDQILANNMAAVRAMTNHMVENGHKNLLYFSCENSGLFNVSRRDEAAETVRLECLKKGVMLQIVPFTHYKAYLRDHVRPEQNGNTAITGILCNNRNVFLAVASELVELGLRIPSDISLIGIDPVDVALPFVPEATCFDMQDDKRGAYAVRRLIDRAEGNVDEVMTIEIAPSFIRGKTVKGGIYYD